ncbi:MAG: hypothetical protein R3A45_10065 [Bdellovibrionota bacterium]
MRYFFGETLRVKRFQKDSTLYYHDEHTLQTAVSTWTYSPASNTAVINFTTIFDEMYSYGPEKNFSLALYHEWAHELWFRTPQNIQSNYITPHWEKTDGIWITQSGEFLTDYSRQVNCAKDKENCLPGEDFPEHFALYMLQNDYLLHRAPKKHAFIKTTMFKHYAAKEYTLQNFTYTISEDVSGKVPKNTPHIQSLKLSNLIHDPQSFPQIKMRLDLDSVHYSLKHLWKWMKVYVVTPEGCRAKASAPILPYQNDLKPLQTGSIGATNGKKTFWLDEQSIVWCEGSVFTVESIELEDSYGNTTILSQKEVQALCPQCKDPFVLKNPVKKNLDRSFYYFNLDAFELPISISEEDISIQWTTINRYPVANIEIPNPIPNLPLKKISLDLQGSCASSQKVLIDATQFKSEEGKYKFQWSHLSSAPDCQELLIRSITLYADKFLEKNGERLVNDNIVIHLNPPIKIQLPKIDTSLRLAPDSKILESAQHSHFSIDVDRDKYYKPVLKLSTSHNMPYSFSGVHFTLVTPYKKKIGYHSMGQSNVADSDSLSFSYKGEKSHELIRDGTYEVQDIKVRYRPTKKLIPGLYEDLKLETSKIVFEYENKALPEKKN